jgi:error-prone DNA polymerase
VQVRAIDITQSAWDHTIELPDARVLVPHDGTVQWRAGAGPVAADDTTTPTTAPHKRAETKAASHTAPVVRLGVRLLRGLGAKARAELERALAHGPFTSVTEFVQRVKLDRASLTHLAECGAFDALFEHEPPARRRRVALWELLAAQRGDDDAQSIAGRITLTGRLP